METPVNTNNNNNSIEQRFFNEHASTAPLMNALNGFLQRTNDTLHFVEKTVSRIGYPRWDKALSLTKPATAGKGNSADSTTITYIPFVRDSQNNVNATMVIQSNPVYTSFSYNCDWQYAQKQNSLNSYKDTAEYYAVFFMEMDKRVFGNRTYKLLDSNLFRNGNSRPYYISFSDAVNNYGRNNSYEFVEYCEDVMIYFFVQCPYPNSPECINGCDHCILCMDNIVYTYCWYEYVEGGGSGGNPGDGSGGDGGATGGEGGGTPPDCDPNPTEGNRISSNLPACGPGWEPVPIEDEPPFQMPYYIFSNLTKPCLKTVLNKLSGGTSNTFFNQIYNTFDTSSIKHLFINEGDLTDDSAYGLASSPLVLPTSGVSFDITMDTVDLLNCSQEWMAYVFIHEVAHAAMFANVIQWDTANPQHYAMASQFLALMASSLMIAYPSLPEFDAYAICFSGFYNGIEGNPTPVDKAFSLLVAQKIAQKFNVAYDDQQIADFGNQYTQSGTKGLRNTCN